MCGQVTRDKRRGARFEERGSRKPNRGSYYRSMGMRFLLLVGITYTGLAFATDAIAPVGTFSNNTCIACHSKKNPQLVAAWRASAHGKDKGGASCVACHGRSHQGSAASARVNTSCINCHGGAKNPTVHSYATSKHGVLYTLEHQSWDWSQGLARANYRSPSCAYCHLHQGNHNVSDGVRHNLMDKAGLNDLRGVCHDCHAPRYVKRLFENGEAMLEVGRMKLREAEKILQQARAEFTERQLAVAEQQLEKMRSQHLNNVLLGVGHQSPDYQWWHGHPALDGDLLRIKGAIGELHRRKAIGSAKNRQDSPQKNNP